jgi:Leucine-rich repeat (LRR) protein
MDYQSMPPIPDLFETGDLRRIKSFTGNKIRFVLQNRKLKNLSIQAQDFSNVPHVEFDLSYNKTLDYISVFDTLAALKNLKGLGLIKNEMKVLHDSIGNLSSLEILELWSNGLKILPPGFSKLKELQYLNLRNNNLTEFPELLASFNKLRVLNLRFNKIKTLPACLFKLTQLEELDLSSCGLTAIPEDIGKLVNLKKLELESNDLKTLPEGIKKLQKLECIQLKGNKSLDMEQVCSLLSHLPELKTLSFKDWNLTSLPHSLGMMEQLETLELGGNKFKKLPESFKKLKNLKECSLGDNPFLEPASYFDILAALPQFKEYNNYNTPFFGNEDAPAALPDNIGNLQDIQSLSFHYVKGLNFIPETLGNLVHLQAFDLTESAVERLPESIGNMQGLTSLTLWGNKKLKTLPESFYQLTALKELHFAHNGIKPDWSRLTQFTNLEELTLDNVNEEVLRHLLKMQSLKEIRWYDENLKTFPDSFYQLKGIQKIDFLNFPHIDLDAVWEKLPQMKSIREIYFHFDQTKPLNWFIEKLQLLPNLEKVNLYTFDRVIPPSITKLGYIKDISLDIKMSYSENTDIEISLEYALMSGDGIKFSSNTKSIKRAKEAIEKINALDIKTEKERMIAFALLTGNYNPLKTLLSNPFVGENKLNGALVFIAGKPSLGTLKETKDKLTEKGAKIKTKTEEVTHILLTPNINEQEIENLFNKGFNFLLEDHLKEHLIQEDTPYLIVEENTELVKQITRLLKDRNEDQLTLILQIIEGGGANRLLISYLMAIHLFHDDMEIRKKSRNLFKKYASSDLQNYVKNNWKDSYFDKDYGDFKRIYHHKEVDIFAFILAFKMIRWRQAFKKGEINDYFMHKFGYLDLDKITSEEFTRTIEECDFIQKLHFQPINSFTEEFIYERIGNLPLLSINIEQLFETFPVSFLQISTLKFLTIRHWQQDKVMNIPSLAGAKAQLKELYLYNHQLHNAENLRTLTTLERLDLYNAGLTDISFIEPLKGLKYLNLTNNNLTSLPAFLENFKLLENLSLENNPLKNIHLNFGNLPELKSLYLGNCQLESLPDTFEGCNELSDIYLKENNLTRLPLSIFSSSRNSYRGVNIQASKNKIVGIGPDLYNLDKSNRPSNSSYKLGRINLSENGLCEIPSFFLNCKSISELDLRNNPIQHIPETLSKVDIETLVLTDTEIKEIPLDIFQMKSYMIRISTSCDNLILPDEKDIPPHSANIYISSLGKNKEKVENFMKVLKEKRIQQNEW